MHYIHEVNESFKSEKEKCPGVIVRMLLVEVCQNALFKFNVLCSYMGSFPQDGENEQNLSYFFFLWSFTVTKRFYFFKFSQLF